MTYLLNKFIIAIIILVFNIIINVINILFHKKTRF